MDACCRRFPHWHRALVLADGAENIAITGQGVINGSNVVDAEGEEGVRGPHAVLFGNCKNVRLRDISIHNAGNYAILLEFTSDVEVRGVKVLGGYDGVHFRGWIDNPCRNVSIRDCEFYTGDDCIAGWHWQDTLIDRCVLNSASNGIRLFGPAKHVIVHNCLFFGPGRYPWRTLGLTSRKNMTSGLCIQPSAWGATEGIVDDVQVSDVVMRDVGTPLHLVAQSPSTIGRITIDRLSATGIYRAAASIESWVAEPIARVDIRDSNLNFVGGFGPVWSDPAEAAMSYLTKQSDQVGPPGMNPRPLPAWGIYARHVTSLNLSDVRIEVDNDDDRPAIIMDDIDSLEIDSLRWPSGTHRPMVLKNLRRIAQSGLTIPVVEAECLSLAASSDCKIVTATVQCNQSGLAKIELKLDKRTVTRWTWLLADEKVDVIFADLPKPDGQQWREIVCGSIRADKPKFSD